LLSSIVPSSQQTVVDPINIRKKIESRSRGHRRAVQIVIGALLLVGASVWYFTRAQTMQERERVIRKLVSVGTRMLSGGGHPTNPPSPIVVQLNADLIQVTSIALGHPRLAVVNGKRVGEGDTVTVHTPVRSIAVTLRVLEISDRQVKLSDGMQTIIAHLSIVGPDGKRSEAK
jgi:hypothetical protein